MKGASGLVRYMFVIAVLGLGACGREDILSVEPDDAPGTAARTVEIALTPDRVTSWIDSTFVGFTDVVNLGFMRLEDGTSELTARGLLRYTNFPDSVFVGDSLSPVIRYDSARLVLTIDTANSALASGGTTLQLRTVTQPWDPGSADWQLAVDTPGVGLAWTSPGGDFDEVLGVAELGSDSDSVVFDLSARSDSLIRLWDDTTQTNTGLGITIADSGRVVVAGFVLSYLTVPEAAPDTALAAVKLDAATTFIFDPPLPALTPGTLRLGGALGGRAYMEIRLPDTVIVATPDGDRSLGLRGSTINLAELSLISRADPPAPFGADRSYSVGAVELGDDFRRFGPKTPVGNGIPGSLAEIDPDSLSGGDTLRIPLTGFIQEWASTPAGVTPPPLRFGVLSSPEATTFGFREFGAVQGDPAFVPSLRLIFTPATDFEVP